MSDDPDDWDEAEWIRRLNATTVFAPDLDPMTVVEAVNSGHITLDADGRPIALSMAAQMATEMYNVVDEIERGHE